MKTLKIMQRECGCGMCKTEDRSTAHRVESQSTTVDWSHSIWLHSKQGREPGEERAHTKGRSVNMTHLDRRPGADVFTGDASEGRQRSGRLRGRGRGAGLVGTLGVLSSAGMVVATRRLAFWVAVASIDALVVLLGADEVGDCLGVFRGVGGFAVVADAAVGEGVLLRTWVSNTSVVGFWI